MCDKVLINVFLHLFIFLIDIKLRKCVTKLIKYVPDQYKTQKICQRKAL